MKLSCGKGSLAVQRLLWDLGDVLLQVFWLACGLVTQPGVKTMDIGITLTAFLLSADHVPSQVEPVLNPLLT